MADSRCIVIQIAIILNTMRDEKDAFLSLTIILALNLRRPISFVHQLISVAF